MGSKCHGLKENPKSPIRMANSPPGGVKIYGQDSELSFPSSSRVTSRGWYRMVPSGRLSAVRCKNTPSLSGKTSSSPRNSDARTLCTRSPGRGGLHLLFAQKQRRANALHPLAGQKCDGPIYGHLAVLHLRFSQT